MNWPQSDSEHLIVSSEQMQNIEKEMFSMGMPVEALMEKVGIGISSWILDRHGLIENGAIVLVGPGHNGGDGLVVARELYMACLLYTSPSPRDKRQSRMPSSA